MRKSLFNVLGATAVLGAALLTTTAASAAPHTRAAPAVGDPDTTVTFTVTTGALSMTAPAAATLGTGNGLPGTTISGELGAPGVVVTDDRAALNAIWTATASANAFTNATAGGGTIPATAATYDPGDITTTGTVSAVSPTPGTPIGLSGTPADVVLGTGVVGDNTATWDPTIAVAIPGFAVNGVYSDTLTQSVS